MGFHHLSAPPATHIDLEQGPELPVKRARGLPTTNKHHSLWASGSSSLRHLV
jgi:hypothetical protein